MRRTRLDDVLDIDSLCDGHVANDGEDGEPSIETRQEAYDVDQDGIPANKPYNQMCFIRKSTQTVNFPKLPNLLSLYSIYIIFFTLFVTLFYWICLLFCHTCLGISILIEVSQYWKERERKYYTHNCIIARQVGQTPKTMSIVDIVYFHIHTIILHDLFQLS